jgi:nucleoside-diphosphate-sugar epimerase
MRILVTGATGFIGSHVIPALQKRGIEVIASSTSIETAAAKPWFPAATYIPFRFGSDPVDGSLFEKFQKPDAVIHLAWQGLPNYKSLFHFEENLYQHYFFLKELVAGGLKDLLVTGTCFEYGMKSGCLDEEMVTDPSNPYAIAKDSLRKFLEQLQKTHPFILKWVRLFYMYGPGQNPKSLLAQLETALQNGDVVFNMSGGEQVRDYLPIEKVAENIVGIALQTHVTGIINCCSGKPVTVMQTVKDYIQRSGKQIQLNPGYYPYPDYEPMEFWGSKEKLNGLKPNEE